MVRVAHVITGLGLGGAEVMLDRLLSAFDAQRVESQVISLTGGPVASRIRAQHVPLQVLGLSSPLSAMVSIPRLASLLRAQRPDVVHTWMYHADLLGGLAGKLVGIPVLWALHATTLDPTETNRTTRLLVHSLAKLSKVLPDHVVSCSRVGLESHRDRGYPESRMSVIPNGFDLSRFKPDQQLRQKARASWGFGENEVVVGHVGRFHPQKDHRTLLASAALAHAQDARLRFVCFGTDVTDGNAQLMSWARGSGVLSISRFLGPHASVQEVLPGFDIFVSPARFGEAFPLVIGEAMACGVPCVVTNVGDSALLVGDTGHVVPPAAPAALAEALRAVAALDWEQRRGLGARATQRVKENYALARIADRYSQLYEDVAARRLTT
jgi:glycosyltransferase involved in cell wall biosynthesis